MKHILYIFIPFFLFTYCKKEDKASSVNFHYDYIPTEVGTWAEYEVREITHTSTGVHDTLHYLLKEEVALEIEDNNYRFERFWRSNTNENWEIKDVWTRTISPTLFQQTEENINFNKLVFPVKKNQIWNGNAFNNQDELLYEYSNLHENYNLNNFNFDSTVTVIQQENINAIEYQTANEVYAKNIGLVYKEKIDLDINFFDKEDINEGTELEMKLIGYGN